MNLDSKKLAIIGLGYVGLPLAVEFGKTRSTIAFDINEDRIAELRLGKDRTLETSASDLKASKHIEYVSDEARLGECGIFIITVPTPIDAANSPDLSPLILASEMVGKYLRKGSVVIYESTVYPGCTEEVCVPILERASGLRFNEEFYCGYSPERVNPGDKKNTLTDIMKIVSGSSWDTANAVDKLYSSIITAGTWRASSIKVAEAAKVIENAQRDINIAFVNELSQIFELVGIDTSEVLEAASTKWNFIPFRPGLVGGHCIGVDPYYLIHKAKELGHHSEVMLAGRRINDDMPVYAARSIIRLMIKNSIDISKSTIGVMGVTFKEDCPDIRNSKAFELIFELQSWGAKVVAIDPLACSVEVESEYGLKLSSIDEQTGKLDSLVVAVGHKKFSEMDPKNLRRLCKPKKTPVLADLKALYDRRFCTDLGFEVFRL